MMGKFEKRYAELKAEEALLEAELATVREWLAESVRTQSLPDNPYVPLRRMKSDGSVVTATLGQAPVRWSPLAMCGGDLF
jgi:hypothetical protein